MDYCSKPHSTTPHIAGCPGHDPAGVPARAVQDPERPVLWDVLTAEGARIATYERAHEADMHLIGLPPSEPEHGDAEAIGTRITQAVERRARGPRLKAARANLAYAREQWAVHVAECATCGDATRAAPWLDCRTGDARHRAVTRAEYAVEMCSQPPRKRPVWA